MPCSLVPAEFIRQDFAPLALDASPDSYQELKQLMLLMVYPAGGL